MSDLIKEVMGIPRATPEYRARRNLWSHVIGVGYEAHPPKDEFYYLKSGVHWSFDARAPAIEKISRGALQKRLPLVRALEKETGLRKDIRGEINLGRVGPFGSIEELKRTSEARNLFEVRTKVPRGRHHRIASQFPEGFRKQVLRNVSGFWIHAGDRVDPLLSREISVSSYGVRSFGGHQNETNKINIFEGVVSYLFPHDVASKVSDAGLREPRGLWSKWSAYDEGFLVPKRSKFLGQVSLEEYEADPGGVLERLTGKRYKFSERPKDKRFPEFRPLAPAEIGLNPVSRTFKMDSVPTWRVDTQLRQLPNFNLLESLGWSTGYKEESLVGRAFSGEDWFIDTYTKKIRVSNKLRGSKLEHLGHLLIGHALDVEMRNRGWGSLLGEGILSEAAESFDRGRVKWKNEGGRRLGAQASFYRTTVLGGEVFDQATSTTSTRQLLRAISFIHNEQNPNFDKSLSPRFITSDRAYDKRFGDKRRDAPATKLYHRGLPTPGSPKSAPLPLHKQALGELKRLGWDVVDAPLKSDGRGVTDILDKRIYLREGMPGFTREAVLAHEVGHALDFEHRARFGSPLFGHAIDSRLVRADAERINRNYTGTGHSLSNVELSMEAHAETFSRLTRGFDSHGVTEQDALDSIFKLKHVEPLTPQQLLAGTRVGRAHSRGPGGGTPPGKPPNGSAPGAWPRKGPLTTGAVLADIETVNLVRGSGIWQVGLVDLDLKTVHEWLPSPHRVQLFDEGKQDFTKLGETRSPVLKFKDMKPDGWREVIRQHLSEQWDQTGGGIPSAELDDFIDRHEPFLKEHLDKITQGRNPLQTQRLIEKIKAEGFTPATVGKAADIRELLSAGGEFAEHTKGKVLWIANVHFEGSQFGAISGALDEEQRAENELAQRQGREPKQLKEADFYKQLEHHPTKSSMGRRMFVTGKEANQARTIARFTGDWRGLYEPYFNTKVKPGETIVRDLLDLPKIMHSYAEHLGMAKNSLGQMGHSVDVVSQLLRPGLGAETHDAVMDSLVHSRVVLEEMEEIIPALHEVQMNTPRGRELVREAKSGRGALHKASMFLARKEAAMPLVHESALAQRLSRAYIDIHTSGGGTHTMTEQTLSTIHSDNVTPSGETFKIPVAINNRKDYQYNDMEKVFMKLKDQYQHGDAQSVWDQFQDQVGSVEDAIKFSHDRSMSLKDKLSNVTPNDIPSYLLRRGLKANLPLAPAGIAVAGAIGMGMGIGIGMSQFRDERPHPKSIHTINYHSWLKNQQEFYGMQGHEDTMSHRGVAGKHRSMHTDFASPYQGPITSNMVLIEQQMLLAREKKLNQAYGIPDSRQNAFQPWSMVDPRQILKGLGSTHQRFLQGGEMVQDYRGTTGNLRKLSLKNYKISFEDGDTLTLQRAGLRGTISNMLGVGEKQSFRFAGIDTPEIAHGQNRAQPYANESTRQLVQLMSRGKKNAEVVFDPTDISYGRGVGVFFADGKNINQEMVRRGAAVASAFGKVESDVLDRRVMSSIEARGFNAHRGLFALPYYRAYYESMIGTGRANFTSIQQLDRAAENSGVISAASLMHQAQSMGMYNTAHQVAAADIAKKYKAGSDIPKPVIHPTPTAHYRQYMAELQGDVTRFLESKGQSDISRNSLMPRKYRNLDKTMVLDSMHSTNSMWNRKTGYTYGQYHKDSVRKHRMAAEQRSALERMQQSPIGHHRFGAR